MHHPGSPDGTAPPRVSVIVPNYNHGRFLARRMDSILGQTYRDCEIIVLDDASSDDSVAVLKQYIMHPKIRLIVRHRNSGSTFVQWNAGVAMARGEYIWIAESDDYATPRFLEELVPVLDQNPHVGLVKCKSQFVDEFDRPIVGVGELPPSRDWSEDFIIDGREDCRLQLVHGTSIVNASAVLFRRKLYIDAGWADPSYRMVADWLQWARMMLRADFAYVARTLNYYRLHRNTVRAKCVGTIIHDLEDLKVCAYLLSQVSVSSDVTCKLCDRFVRRWLGHSLGRSRIKHSITYDLQILRILRQIDRHYVTRIIRCFMSKMYRRIGNRHVEGTRVGSESGPT